MSQQFEQDRSEDGLEEARAGVPARPETGVGSVDAVLDSLEGLDDRPVGDHVAVFEAAHEQLRAALSDAGDRTAG